MADERLDLGRRFQRRESDDARAGVPDPLQDRRPLARGRHPKGKLQGRPHRRANRLAIEGIRAGRRQHDPGRAERRGVAEDRADVVRVGHPVEHHERAPRRRRRELGNILPGPGTFAESQAAAVEPEAGDAPQLDGVRDVQVESPVIPTDRQGPFQSLQRVVDEQEGARAEARRQQALHRQPALGDEKAALAHQGRVRDDTEIVEAGVVDGCDADPVDGHRQPASYSRAGDAAVPGYRTIRVHARRERRYAERSTCRRLRCRSSTSRPICLLR